MVRLEMAYRIHGPEPIQLGHAGELYTATATHIVELHLERRPMLEFFLIQALSRKEYSNH
jgi:hypothetical protein